jgi:hypothetical protein
MHYGICQNRYNEVYTAPTDLIDPAIGWYLNDAGEEHNLAYDQWRYAYYAIRDIQAGEELTINYEQLNEQ